MPVHTTHTLEGSIEEFSNGFTSDVPHAYYGILVAHVVHVWAGSLNVAKLCFWVGATCTSGRFAYGI